MDLHSGEQIIFQGHPSWRSTLQFYLLGLLLAAAAGIIAALIEDTGLGVAVGIGVLVLVLVVALTPVPPVVVVVVVSLVTWAKAVLNATALAAPTANNLINGVCFMFVLCFG